MSKPKPLTESLNLSFLRSSQRISIKQSPRTSPKNGSPKSLKKSVNPLSPK